MNEEFKKELLEIRLQQRNLLESMNRLDERLRSLTQKLQQPEAAEFIAPPNRQPPPLPPNFKDAPAKPDPVRVEAESSQAALMNASVLRTPSTPKPIPSAGIPDSSTSDQVKESFEFRLGRVWLVRVAVVLFLTGLVLLGNLTYQHFITLLSPMAKAFGLYFIAGTLIGLGLVLEKWKESLRNYSQVILGAGMAAVYYTTYASHFVPALRWIDSVSLVALLLLACAGAMTWVADWKKSQTLGNIGLLLAYYSCVIQPATWFTFASNLLLGVAAMILWLRNGWSRCSWMALIATYGTFFYWQTPSLGMSAGLSFQLSLAFLLAYWILFTVGVFLCRRLDTQDENKAAFLTLNNMAFYGLLSFVMPSFMRAEQLWFITLLFGFILCALGILGVAKAQQSKLVANAYVIQGLLLITTGICLKLSGYQLAILLILQSFTVLAAAREPFRYLMKLAAGVLAFLAVTVGMMVFTDKSNSHLAIGVFVGSVLLLNAWWQRNYLKLDTKNYDLRLGAFYYIGLALLSFLTVCLVNIPDPFKTPSMALIAILLLWLGITLRLPELSLGGQSFLWTALALSLFSHFGSPPAWWNPMIVVSSALFLSYWWEHKSRIKIDSWLIQTAVFLASGCSTALLYLWFETHFSFNEWLLYGGVLTFGFFLYGLVFRNGSIALFSQLFLVISIGHFFDKTTSHEISWLLALLPIAATLAMSLSLRELLVHESETPASSSQTLYRWSALAYRLLTKLMVLFWVHTFITDIYLPGFLGLIGLICALTSGKREDGLRYGFGVLLIVTGLLYSWFDPVRGAVTRWTDLVVILAPALLQQIDQRWALRNWKGRWQEVLEIVLTLGTLWLFVSRFVTQHSGGFYLSVSWSILALSVFCVGLFLRERVYRLAGLTILGCTLGRIVFIDLWQFGTLSRILSLMVSGAVLGVLGYIYNRYAESIKKYL